MIVALGGQILWQIITAAANAAHEMKMRCGQKSSLAASETARHDPTYRA